MTEKSCISSAQIASCLSWIESVGKPRYYILVGMERGENLACIHPKSSPGAGFSFYGQDEKRRAAIVGQYLEPDAHLTYHSMWGSVIMAFLCILPSFLLHSTKDLSIRQVMTRRVIQVLMIEGIVLGFLYIVVSMRDIKTVRAV